MSKFKQGIIEILGKWNFWGREIDTVVLREKYTDRLTDFVKADKVISIVGVRRCGKSCIAKQIAKKLIEEGIEKERILIINFEDPDFEHADLNFLQKIYEAYLEIIKPQGKPFIFLDEIQDVQKWEKFVRALNERKEAFIVITGSSSKLLSDELATVLAGRQVYFEIFPLDFKEFLKFKGIEIKDIKDYLLNAQKIKILLREYFKFGAFPEVVLTDNEEFKINILRSYFEDILIKDIIRRFKIKEIEKLRGLVRYYLTNISSCITFNSISKFLNLPVETVSRYTSFIEISKSLFFIKRFSFSIKEYEKAPRKVYSIDIGLSNVAGFRFTENPGRVMENLVAIELKRRADDKNLEIYYWKDYDEKEVDFVVKNELNVEQLIQVRYSLSDIKTKDGEINGLIRGSEKLKCDDLLVITEDYGGVENIKNKRVIFKPLWKWLLEEKIAENQISNK